MRIGIDLLWVRTGICGGTESYIRSLLDGFARYDRKNEYLLFVAEDQADSFGKYAQVQRMHLKVCRVKSVDTTALGEFVSGSCGSQESGGSSVCAGIQQAGVIWERGFLCQRDS